MIRLALRRPVAAYTPTSTPCWIVDASPEAPVVVRCGAIVVTLTAKPGETPAARRERAAAIVAVLNRIYGYAA